MDDPPTLESLPDELLIRVLSYLTPTEKAALQQVSRRILRVSRDNTLWKHLSFNKSLQIDDVHGRRALFDPEVPECTAKPGSAEYTRLLENWDPFYPGEPTNWYDEYIQRNGPISVNWFQQAYRNVNFARYYLDARGMALWHPKAHRGTSIAVTPMADGSVYLWDVRGTKEKRGSVLAKSDVGSIFYEGKGKGRRDELADTGVVECVAVDSDRDMAFVAVESHLMHIDLKTLRTVSSITFPWVIGSLSSTQPGVPLTVGTNLGIHLYDHRTNVKPRHDRDEKLEKPASGAYQSLIDTLFLSPLPAYAPLPQPGPLSILHLENPGQPNSVSDDIYVTGRFSNILLYDRRKFDHMVSSIHSGARLCTLSSLPYSSSVFDYEYRSKGLYSLAQVDASKQLDGGRTIIAGGEYNSKGSLELYDLLPPNRSTLNHSSGELQRGTMKNRQTASSSKILSVVTHGSRIALSDSSGFVKWFERDGFTEVRRWKIGHSFMGATHSLFASMPGSDDVARKMLVTSNPGEDDAGINRSDILFWTGEKLGLMRFSARAGTVPGDFEGDATQTPEELEMEENERLHSQRMRDALQRHADEVRFVQELGL
ncbi:uncharacterized protein MKZ38_009943 [Zalerion maritima]|uniref:F-box domain-containing protein n=1 Tax=Zalerion maritima TaxID=339359 RepID=A0AAD5RTT4_9PEZI|nr:uncharacterized protein MKZ38_009943 [Zalerion maritima]